MEALEGNERADEIAGFAKEQRADGETIVLTGHWTLRGLGRRIAALSDNLRPYAARREVRWDLTELERMDNVGALVLGHVHGFTQPPNLAVRPEHAAFFRRWSERAAPAEPLPRPPPTPWEAGLLLVRIAREQTVELVILIGQFALDLRDAWRNPLRAPWTGVTATIHEAGTRALGIMALIGILVGIVMSYLSALELRSFGASSYIVDILGISIMRELGPLLTAILVAGRSGSAMTAELGVMTLTGEFDALASMGISRSMRLILPKIIALFVAVPLLVMWTNAMALIAGMFTAHITLDIGYRSFIHAIPRVVPVVNLLLGLGKGAVFGSIIAVVSCHFGLRIRPNTLSLGRETTNAVVVSITLVIFVDAIFAILFRATGLP